MNNIADYMHNKSESAIEVIDKQFNNPVDILLICLQEKCPRTKKIKTDSTIPEGTIIMESYCDWHYPEGCKDLQEYYYNKSGNQIEVLPEGVI